MITLRHFTFAALILRAVRKQTLLVPVGVALCHLFLAADPACAQGTAFTYQGRLNLAGVPANGAYDFLFALMNDPTNVSGAELGGYSQAPATPVTNGLFTVLLNSSNEFGANAFTGGARWLWIGVRTNNDPAGYIFLSPRQPLTPSPYAEFAGAANTANTAGTANTANTAAVASAVAAGSVNSNSLANNTIITANLADNSVVTAKIADGSVTTPKLANAAVTSAKLATGAVTALQLGTGAAVANLAASGQTAVPSGGVIMSASSANTKNLLNAGYVKVGAVNLVAESWTTNFYAGPPATGSLTAPRAQHTAVWTGSEMIIWGGNDGVTHNNGARYNPTANSWTVVNANSGLAAREGHAAVWTGSQMLIWGGFDNALNPLGDGARYTPASDSWTAMTGLGAPAARGFPTAIWSGSRMVVWGGYQYLSDGYYYNAYDVPSGGRYDPVGNAWTPVTTNGAPVYSTGHTAVWSGTEMLVFGGNNYAFSGGRYNPTANTWAAMNPNTTLGSYGLQDHSAVWTGSNMIVWGGLTDNGNIAVATNSGARYNPSANTWTSMPMAGAPTSRYLHTAIWTGSKMIIWGGYNYNYGDNDYNDGATYDPAANSWTALSINNAPAARDSHTAVWTGSAMIIWGGQDSYSGYYGYSYSYPEPGGSYNPSFNLWNPMPTAPGSGEPAPRQSASAVWTGSEMIIWGGENGGFYLRTGGRFNPAANNWISVTTQGAPSGRLHHTAVWTGTNMIVWGGSDQSGPLGNGARYNPVADIWSNLSGSNAPAARLNHVAVWDGSEMLIWGGSSGYALVPPPPAGGRYSPATDSWKAINTTNQPNVVASSAAVWTGQEMLVWGGSVPLFSTSYYATGGRYNPATDSWVLMSNNNAPSARSGHTAVWTGTDYIVFGGTNGVTNVNTGARYTLATDTWTSLSLSNAPSPRSLHGSVWTGDQMIVYGGFAPNGGNNNYPYSGSLYNPETDTWTPLIYSNVVPGCANFCTVWTGAGMLIWGGVNSAGYLQQPFLYTPARTMDLLLRP